MALKRMDSVGIVVDDLTAAIDFFRELGLDLEGRRTIEGEWAGRGVEQGGGVMPARFRKFAAPRVGRRASFRSPVSRR